MKDAVIPLLFLGGVLYILRESTPPTPQEQAVEALKSPVGQAALSNIGSVYGEAFTENLAKSVVTRDTAGEVFADMKKGIFAVETLPGVYGYDTASAVASMDSAANNPTIGETDIEEIRRKYKTTLAEIKRQDKYRKKGVLSNPRQEKLNRLLEYAETKKQEAARLGVML